MDFSLNKLNALLFQDNHVLKFLLFQLFAFPLLILIETALKILEINVVPNPLINYCEIHLKKYLMNI